MALIVVILPVVRTPTKFGSEKEVPDAGLGQFFLQDLVVELRSKAGVRGRAYVHDNIDPVLFQHRSKGFPGMRGMADGVYDAHKRF